MGRLYYVEVPEKKYIELDGIRVLYRYKIPMTAKYIAVIDIHTRYLDIIGRIKLYQKNDINHIPINKKTMTNVISKSTLYDILQPYYDISSSKYNCFKNIIITIVNNPISNTLPVMYDNNILIGFDFNNNEIRGKNLWKEICLKRDLKIKTIHNIAIIPTQLSLSIFLPDNILEILNRYSALSTGLYIKSEYKQPLYSFDRELRPSVVTNSLLNDKLLQSNRHLIIV